MSTNLSSEEEQPPIKHLSRGERRVLGVLIEKGLTTPDQYPLTLKSCTTGCNQKNNRDPVTNYDEDQVSDILEKLRGKGLVAEVFSDGARAAKYRHYMRKRMPMSEPQLAILCELLLRGRQQPGDLRTRASRMVDIPTQEQLRTELSGLVERGLVQANGPLDRRGVDVDHTLYEPQEGVRMSQATFASDESASPAPAARSGSPVTHAPAPSHVAAASSEIERRLEELARQVTELVAARQELSTELAKLRDEHNQLARSLTDLRDSLGA